MKTARLSITLFLLGAALTLGVAAAPSTTPVKTPAPETNAVPESVFTIPTKAGEARDPFFPNRIIQQESSKPVAATNAPPSGISCLVLKGLSGVPSNPLAMINGRTMARGEDAEINTACGRLLVHCVDITTNSAVVEVGGQRRELFLPSGF